MDGSERTWAFSDFLSDILLSYGIIVELAQEYWPAAIVVAGLLVILGPYTNRGRRWGLLFLLPIWLSPLIASGLKPIMDSRVDSASSLAQQLPTYFMLCAGLLVLITLIAARGHRLFGLVAGVVGLAVALAAGVSLGMELFLDF